MKNIKAKECKPYVFFAKPELKTVLSSFYQDTGLRATLTSCHKAAGFRLSPYLFYAGECKIVRYMSIELIIHCVTKK